MRALLPPAGLALALLLGAGPAAAERLSLPVTVQGVGVTVRAPARMDRVAKRVAAEAPGALDAIYADLAGLPRPDHIEIRLVANASELQAVSPGPVPEWAVGLAYSRRGLVLAAAHRDGAPTEIHQVVVHELAHMALGAALTDRAPRWLDEGFAYLHSADWSFARARTLTGMAWSGNRYLLYELEQQFPAREAAAGRAYAQSYDFVGFLAQRGWYADGSGQGGRHAFRLFLRTIAEGESLDDAALTAFGVRLQDLEQEWWTTMKQRYMFAPMGLVSLFIWFAGAVLLVLAWLRRRRQARAKLAQWAIEEQQVQFPS